jgi:hypothetical protein
MQKGSYAGQPFGVLFGDQLGAVLNFLGNIRPLFDLTGGGRGTGIEPSPRSLQSSRGSKRVWFPKIGTTGAPRSYREMVVRPHSLPPAGPQPKGRVDEPGAGFRPRDQAVP